MTQAISDNLQHYLDGLDQRAELHMQAQRIDAYATGLRRGFVEGFGLASIISIVIWVLWWCFHG